MLITLQSNNNADASDFTNYFRETGMIEPKSELALVNISYKFENGITITTGVNDTFRVSIGTDNDFGVATVPPGEYATDAEFATACELALHGFINTQTYWKKQAFPLSSQSFTLDGASTDRLKITLQYDPQEWNSALIGTAASVSLRQQAFGNNAGILPSQNKGIAKRVTVETGAGAYNTDNWNSGTGVDRANTNVIWATARDTTQQVQHGKISWKGYRTNDVEWVVGVVDGDLPVSNAQWQNGSTVLPIAVRCMANATLRISERNNNGVLSTIKDNIPVADFEDIEIHFDQVTESSTETYAKYFVGGIQIIIDPTAAERWTLRPSLNLVPCGSLRTPDVTSEIIDGASSYKLDNVATSKTLNNGGTGYYNGEVVEVEFASGSKTTMLATVNNSIIQSLVFQEHGGNVDLAGEGPLTLTGLMSGAATATATFGDIEESVTILVGGVSYNTNPADVVIDGSTIANAVTITTIGGGGDILDFEWTDLLTNIDFNIGEQIKIVQGGNDSAIIVINAKNQKQNMIYDIVTDVTDRTVDEPLGLHNRATFRPSDGFSLTTSMNAVGPAAATPLTTTGSSSINDGREDKTMLVNVEEFMLKSICKSGGIQKAIASVPYGLTQPFFENGDPVKVDGEFYHEPHNILYHDLSNPGIENHNQLRVRLTDAVGNPIKQLLHPTTLTLDLRPRAK